MLIKDKDVAYMEQSIQFHSENTLDMTELYFSFCGVSKTQPAHQYGPAVRQDYLIHIVLEGEGTFVIGDKRTFLSPNQGFIIKPDISTYYEASLKNPWKYLWLGFNGTRAEEFLEKAGLLGERHIFQLSDSTPFFKLVVQCLQEQSHRMSNELMLNGLTYQFVSLIVKDVVPLSHTKTERMNPRVPDVLTYLSQHFTEPITIQDACNALALERSYVSRIFKQSMGMTIKDFLTHLRISYAAELIKTSDRPIEEVSIRCGFNSHDVFTRAFKSHYDTTPTSFRKKHRRPMDQFNHIQEFEQLLINLPFTD